ncbi:MAG: molybdopterin oxidoreductase family protein [Rhodospirillales bacterium]|nr:molybdopterin oxidoreductase family protein [Rhodospirillales bacterium]
MCACRCGIKVHLSDGAIRYIEGNKAHPVNKGVLCAKGSAGIMTHYAPSRLTKPLLRVGERGSGEFKEIEWEEALSIATRWLGDIRATDARKLAFFTGRDQSQALTGWWASQFGTPNYAAHGGFCSVNMAAAGMYTIGGSFWEFGEPDFHMAKYFMMFGVAEDHASNPIKIGLGQLKGRGAKFVSVNPVRTGYSAIADEWIGIRPGTDGLFIAALIHELLRADKVDFDYLVRYTNAPWLVIDAPGTARDGLFARDDKGTPLCWNGDGNTAASALLPDIRPALIGRRTLADGTQATPVFELMVRRYLDPQYAPDAVAERVGIPADTIRRLAAELAHAAFEQQIVLDIPWTDWAGRRHEKTIGRPVAFHAMRGISAHANGFQTCRLLHVLQILLGAIDCPGGFRHKPPYPKSAPPALKPHGKAEHLTPGKPMPGPPLGFVMGPEDLLVDPDGTPRRIDKAYSWDAPMAAHGLMHMVIHNASQGDPYKIDTLFMFMANMGWNSAMNTSGTIEMLSAKDPETGEYAIPHIIYADAYNSETVAFADLVLPDTTYLERHDCISLLDRPICDADGAADAIRQPVVKPERDVRPFQDVLLELGVRLKLPALIREDGSAKFPGGFADYIANHERTPGVGMLAGFRGAEGNQGGTGAPNPKQVEAYIANGCFWRQEIEPSHRYYRFANKGYLDWAVKMGFLGKADPVVMQLYCEPLQKFRNAARGHGAVQPPDRDRKRIEAYFDPLPFWYPPFEGALVDDDAFPMHAITQRPMAMYHSWGSQNAWLRQIHTANRLYVNRRRATQLGLVDDDWVWVTSHHGRIKVQIKLAEGVNPDTAWTWNAIGKRRGAWALDNDAPESRKGFLLNHLISELLPPQPDGHRYANSDPITGQAAWYDLRVRIEKAREDEAAESVPQFEPAKRPPGMMETPEILRYGAGFRR